MKEKICPPKEWIIPAKHMPVEANTVKFRNEHVTVADIIWSNE